MSRRVTIADVAREAGVSPMTVSRVVNDKGAVSPETRQRVLAVVERLGYRPSGIARSLATRRTSTLGLVVPDVANPFFADVTLGVEHQAYAAGYNVFLCNTNEDPQRELAVLGLLEEKRVDGILLCSSRIEDGPLRSLLTRYPAVVLINRRLEGVPGAVLINDEYGGYLAAHHLIRAGHREIGFLAGPRISHSGRERERGYRAALAEVGIPFDADLVYHCDPVVDGGRAAASALLDARPGITALLCHNDLVAVGALQAVAARGLRVPEDVAVVGYDDIPLAALVTPPLTTCRVPRYELGVQAVEVLLRCLKGDEEPCRDVMLQPELVVRESA